MPRETRTCANCGAWQCPTDEESLGTCRLNPPILHDGMWTFPDAPPHWWCSRWINARKLAVVPKGGDDGSE